MRCAAFNSGPEFHMLDHIAPLAHLMQMPLITTEEKNTRLARRFYPHVKLLYMPDLEMRLGEIATNFDVLFECKFWGTHLKSLFKEFYHKEMRLVFCPHGQSDKGMHSIGQYPLQDAVLLYGDLLVEMLEKLDLWSLISQAAFIGNYRLPFYKQHQSFYDAIAEKLIFSKLPKQNKTLLYAPTWQDAEDSSSFFQWTQRVISQLPSEWNLIIKPHPLLQQKRPAHYYALLAQIERKTNVLFIEEFVPIYPILSRIDILLGDHSSVGYDFLAFNRPLFFLPTSKTTRLHQCGQMIEPDQNIYEQLEHPKCFLQEQKLLYQFAFKEGVDPKQNILRLLSHGRQDKDGL